MSYSELIKNFDKIREYVREFYVYGFKSREEYTEKSKRSYDNEKRRVESWLGEYMRFVRTSDGKTVFLSIDSRAEKHNPLYKAWKSKSFTDGDITLHFIIFDILCDDGKSYSLSEIMTLIDKKYLSCFKNPFVFDESTIRKKLKEYINEGVITWEKQGKIVLYSRNKTSVLPKSKDFLDFFSEVSPCGVIGSFLLDKYENRDDILSFKHHYITSAVDSDILAKIFQGIREKRKISVKKIGFRTKKEIETLVLPLKVLISVQNGRQNLLAYNFSAKAIQSFRIDYLLSVQLKEVFDGFEKIRKRVDEMKGEMWGVSCKQKYNSILEDASFTIKIRPDEDYILRRLHREKRIGKIEKIDNETYKFSVSVFDSEELVPWIRTFIGRITQMNFSNRNIENKFKKDINRLYELYDIDEENSGKGGA